MLQSIGLQRVRHGNNKYVVQLLSRIRLFVTPHTAARQASLSFTISQSLLKFMSIELMASAIQPSSVPSLLLLPSIFLSIRVFSSELALCIKQPNIGVWSSTSVLPVSTQGWFLLGLTGLISLQSKGLSSVFSSTIVWKHPTLTSVHDCWKNHSFDYTDLCGQSNVSPFQYAV